MFLGNVLNYFEKWIYLEFLKSHFLGTKIDYMEDVLKDFSKYPIMDYKRIGKLKLSINSKFICLIEVIRYFGFITAIGIVRRGISRSINYK